MFTCISCRIAFDTAEEQRSHFGTDWHRYNMKRRVANLPPVSAAAFNEKVIERREQNAVRPDPRDMACAACNKSFSTENSYRSHIQSRKHREREAAVARAASSSTPKGTSSAALKADNDVTMRTSEHSTGDAGTASDEDEDEDDEGIESAIAASRRRLPTGACLFCNHRSATLEHSLAHMSKEHSFFIPDQHLLIDLPGLIGYLGEKVVGGNLCLYCPNGGKEFGSTEAVRKHMIDKSHCKIAYETDEDRAELADFYAFDGSLEDEDASEWEDVEDDDTWEEGMPMLSSDGLSLVLPSGRVLGHRALKVYYDQRSRPSSATEDPVKSKVALVRQRLADPSSALVPVAGGHGAFGRGLEVVKARNAGEAAWAKKQGRSFKDQRAREAHKTKVGFRNNNQKHFRDPLLQ